MSKRPVVIIAEDCPACGAPSTDGLCGTCREDLLSGAFPDTYSDGECPVCGGRGSSRGGLCADCSAGR